MIRLVGAELARLRARRTTLLTVIGVLLAVGLFQLVVNDSVTPPSAAEVAKNQQYYDEALKDWEANHAQYEQECIDSGTSAQDCAIPKPTPADYALSATPFSEVTEGAVTFATYLSLLAAYLLAASSIGAEFGTGAIANWLTFVPQRMRVLGSKLIAVALATAVGGAVALALTIGSAAVLTHLHGGTLDRLGHLIATGGRGVALVVIGALLGFCLALLTRHTVAALGVVLAVVLGTYVVAVVANFQDGVARLAPYLPSKNLEGFLAHGTTYVIPTTTLTPEGSSVDYVEKHLSFAHSATYWIALVVAVIVVTALVFRRRDVT